MKFTLSTGETLTFPVVTRGVTQFIAVYDVRAADVNRLLPGDVRAYDMGYGLSEMVIYWLRAEDSDFGPFSELAVNFAVLEPCYRSRALHYFANPVSTARAERVGCEVWGNPTALAEIDIQHEPPELRCTARMDGEQVLTLTSRVAPAGPCQVNALLTARGPGRTNVYRYAQSSRACAAERRPTSVRLEPGPHPLGKQICGLLLDGQASQTFYHRESTILSGPPFAQMFSPRS